MTKELLFSSPPEPAHDPDSDYAMVHCREHGPVYLTKAQYDAQLARPDSTWRCPLCGEEASWSDDYWEWRHYGEDLGNSQHAVLTGSHKYGKPGPDSDIDLAVLMTAEDMKKLYALAEDGSVHCHGDDCMFLRFGKLNLLVSNRDTLLGQKRHQTWIDGVEILKTEAQELGPVTRDRAVECFTALRVEAGVIGTAYVPQKK